MPLYIVQFLSQKKLFYHWLKISLLNWQMRSMRWEKNDSILTVFLLFTSLIILRKWLRCFNRENAICLPTVISAFHHRSKKPTKCFKGGVSLPFIGLLRVQNARRHYEHSTTTSYTIGSRIYSLCFTTDSITWHDSSVKYFRPVMLSGGKFVSQVNNPTNWIREKDNGNSSWQTTSCRW